MALPAFLSRAFQFLTAPAADNERALPIYAPVAKVKGIQPEDPFRIIDRLSVIHTARALYQVDGRYKAVVDTFTDAVVRAGFSFDSDVADPERMMDLSTQYRLPQLLGMWLRNLFLDGDLFLQVMVEGERITGFYPLPATHIRRNADGYDTFPNPDAAYTLIRAEEVESQYAVQDYQQAFGSDGDFTAAEVLHVRWSRTEGSQRYGTPLLAAVHNSLQRAIRSEANIDIRRQVHGSLRLWHKVLDAVTPEQVQEYTNDSELDPEDLSSPVKQYYTGENVEIVPMQGDSNLSQFEDAAYQLEAFWAGCPVPKSVLGYADNVNRDIFAVQQQQYQSHLESVSEFVSQEILAPIMSILLMGDMADVLPSEIRCTFGSRAVFDATSFQAVADALSKLPTGVLAREDATRLLASQLDRNPEELIDNVKEEEPMMAPDVDMPATEPDQPDNPGQGDMNDQPM